MLLDLGAGTGLIGEHLAGGGVGYLGVDVSGPMLAVFRRKLGPGGGALVRADGGAPWPLRGGRVGLVFVSRAAHLLPPAVLVAETLRVASPRGSLFVLGGVESDRDSLRAVLRRQMRRLLAERGVAPRRAAETRRAIAEALAERGGEPLPVRTAASWTTVHRAADALAAWRAKSGLGGQPVPAATQEEVLRELESWIRERFGGLEVERETTERYDLLAVRLPPRSATDEGGDA
ncbi:MAG TPA: methyltransferase domain-containing protein [Thermoanaerobaculia bacterium]|nr:methyltransferase domain-containing protein [Thermoanaerobaculia bacterium]